MGYGDQLIATGLARGAAARGRQIAFGDGRRIIWDSNSPAIFQGNPNIALPGTEKDQDVEWMKYYKGHRVYNTQAPGRWVWNYKWRCIPGEIYFTDEEISFADKIDPGFILVEPNVEKWKNAAANKDWGWKNYRTVVQQLLDNNYQVVQLAYERAGAMLPGVKLITTRSFRQAVTVLARARLYLGPEGGLHHGAAATGINAVVIFGGWVPPQVTGYPAHVNLTGGEKEFCGTLAPCLHCRRALNRITVEEVYDAVQGQLNG